MKQAKGKKATEPANRIEPYLDKPESTGEWLPIHDFRKRLSDPYPVFICHHGSLPASGTTHEQAHARGAAGWEMLAWEMIEQFSLENRVDSLEDRVVLLENKLQEATDRMARIEGLCEKALQKPVCVPISTFAPEPFEVIRDFSVVVQPEEDSFVATLFDANISSSGDTPEEAVTNVKDLILMIFQGFEDEDDSELGPAMIRQKHVLLSLIRRR